MLGVLAAVALTATAHDTSYYSPRSMMSSGRWVKVRVDTNDVHRVDASTLRALGFDDPAKVQVYGYGGAMLTDNRFSTALPDDMTPAYTVHDAEGNVYFYGESGTASTLRDAALLTLRENLYSTAGYYFLSDVSPRVAGVSATAGELSPKFSVVTPGARTMADTHLSTMFVRHALQNRTNGGAAFVGRDLVAGEGETVRVPVTGMKAPADADTRKRASVFQATFAARNTQDTHASLDVPSLINLENIGVTRSAAPYTYDNYVGFRYGTVMMKYNDMMPDSVYTFNVKHPGGNVEFMALHSAWHAYERANVYTGGTLQMDFPGVTVGQEFTLDAPAGAVVLDVTLPDQVIPVEMTRTDTLTYGTFGRNYTLRPATGMSSARLVVFTPGDGVRRAVVEGPVSNQDLHSLAAPDMVIITTATLLDAANELAAIHRAHDGMRVTVVTQDQVFNEFSSGTPCAMAYRRFVKMLRDRNPNAMKYLLLYGAGHYDNRCLALDKADRLLTYQCEFDGRPMYNSQGSLVNTVTYTLNRTRNFSSDAYFGMIDDNYQPEAVYSQEAQVAVGRIPAQNMAAATAANAKIKAYLANRLPSTASSLAINVSDDGDYNIHMKQSQELAGLMLSNRPSMTVVRAHNLLYPWENQDAKVLRSLVTDALRQGAGLWTYVGHAGTSGFGAEALWSRNAVQNTSYAHPPIAHLSSCDTYAFDRLDDGIAETMVYQPNGGAIAVIGAGRTVYGSYNQYLARAVADAWSTATPDMRIGDVYNRARNSVVSISGISAECQANNMCYNLCGDPAIPVAAPMLNASVTEINGSDPYGTFPFTVPAHSVMTLKGIVTDSDGETVTGYDGTLTLRLYDAPCAFPTLVRGPYDQAEDVTLDHSLLAQTTATVKGGRWTATLVPPVPVTAVGPDAVNRLTLHATDATGRVIAAGLYDSLALTTPDTAGGEMPGNAPVIGTVSLDGAAPAADAVYGNSIEFTAAGTLGQSGLNVSQAIGAASNLVIDGSRLVDGAAHAITVNPDGTWQMAQTLEGLANGRHSVTLTVADNTGRAASRTVDFTVASHATLTLSADVHVARRAVTFDIDHDMDALSASRLIIEDRNGHTVANVSNPSWPYTWTWDEATAPADGIYRARVTATDGSRHARTLPLTVTVIKP